jgi:hypothetical protein
LVILSSVVRRRLDHGALSGFCRAESCHAVHGQRQIRNRPDGKSGRRYSSSFGISGSQPEQQV